MNKILITGGSGLVGTVLTQQLQAKSYQVVHLSRHPDKHKRVPSYKWDLEKAYIDEEAFEKVDTIVHLAGANVGKIPWTAQYKREILNSRIQSTQLLGEYLAKHTVKNFISAGATGIYKSAPQTWIDEESEYGSNFLADVCKRWEKAVKNLPVERCVIIRIGVVLSASGGMLPTLLPPAKWGLLSPLGTGRQYISWIHIADLGRLFIKAIEDQTWRGVYNGVAPNPIPNKTMTKIIAEACQRRAFLPAVPSFLLKSGLGSAAIILLDSYRIRSSRVKQSDFKFDFDDFKVAVESCLKQ